MTECRVSEGSGIAAKDFAEFTVFLHHTETKRQGAGVKIAGVSGGQPCAEDYPEYEAIAAPHRRRHKDALCLQGGFEASWFK